MRALRGGIGLAAVAVALVLPGTALATPTATTQPATNITATDAVLNGTFNNGGEQVTWHFDYATADEFVPSGTYPHATRPQADTFLILPWVVPLDEVVSAHVTGLTPKTTYHFRLVAQTNSATAYGQDLTFKTLR